MILWLTIIVAFLRVTTTNIRGEDVSLLSHYSQKEMVPGHQPDYITVQNSFSQEMSQRTVEKENLYLTHTTVLGILFLKRKF